MSLGMVSRESNDGRTTRPIAYVPVGAVVGLILAFIAIIGISVFAAVTRWRRRKSTAVNIPTTSSTTVAGLQGKRPSSALPEEDLPPYPGPAHIPPSYRYDNDDGVSSSGAHVNDSTPSGSHSGSHSLSYPGSHSAGHSSTPGISGVAGVSST